MDSRETLDITELLFGILNGSIEVLEFNGYIDKTKKKGGDKDLKKTKKDKGMKGMMSKEKEKEMEKKMAKKGKGKGGGKGC